MSSNIFCISFTYSPLLIAGSLSSIWQVEKQCNSFQLDRQTVLVITWILIGIQIDFSISHTQGPFSLEAQPLSFGYLIFKPVP